MTGEVLLFFLVLAALFCIVGLVIFAAGKSRRLDTETRGFIEALERSRAFAPVTVPGLNLERGEFVVRRDQAALAEWRMSRVGGGIGTTVRVGRVPIHLGGYKSIPVEELRAVGDGDLVLTNHRLLFIGRHTFAIPFNRLLRCEPTSGGLIISESRWKNPRVVSPNNPALWNFLVTWVAESRLEQPRLPDDVHLGVIGDPPNMRIAVLDRAPITRGILGTPKKREEPA